MIRRGIAALAALLLLVCLSGFAGAENAPAAPPATPTDLDCLHEHVSTIIYFYDPPQYTTLNDRTHRVSGPANVQIVCDDCGQILSDEEEEYAEQVRLHTFKKDVCVLCGFHKPRTQENPEELPGDLPGERTVLALREDGNEDLLTLTLTTEELAALAGEGINTAVVRGGTDVFGIALNVNDMIRQTREKGADLYLEMAERPDDSFFAGVHLAERDGDRTAPEGVTLRFYLESPVDIRVSLAPSEEDVLLETEGSWDEHGFWSVPYLAEGTYFLLR